MTIPLDVDDVVKACKPGRFSRTRAPRIAVDHVSFRVHPGEVYGVIGANGSGKSTLIRILSTLLLPDDGEVRVFGLDAVHDPLAVRPLINGASVAPPSFRGCQRWGNSRF